MQTNVSPILLNSVPTTQRRTNWSRSSIYLMLARGELEAVKDGRRLLITEESIQRRIAGLPKATIGASVKNDEAAGARSPNDRAQH